MSDGMRAAEPTVLMVDDEKEVADAYALRLDGIADVTVAYSGGAALEAVGEGREPDIGLRDRHMPAMSRGEGPTRLRERDLASRGGMGTGGRG